MCVAIVMLSFTGQSFAFSRIHCEKDTIVLNKIANDLSGVPNDFGKRVAAAAKCFVGSDAGMPAWNDSVGTMIIDLHTFDGLALVNNAIALAVYSQKPDRRWYDFSYALENISRRRGSDTGIASQMIYGSDWVVDNVYRGNIKELTDQYNGGLLHKTKSLDYVSQNRQKFPALADSANYEALRMMEMGYRTHRIPHVKKEMVGKASVIDDMKDGDIIILLCKDDNYDVYDMGIVAMENDGPHLIHCDRITGKVTEDEFPLSRLMKREGQYIYGFRWLRPLN